MKNDFKRNDVDYLKRYSPKKLIFFSNPSCAENQEQALQDAKELKALRSKIDQCDKELMLLLEKRMKLAEAIGRYKKANSMSIFQPLRWNDIITKNLREAKNLSVEFVAKIFKAIHQEAINKQTRINR